MKKTIHNYAFIDGQNLNLGIKKLGWKLDYRRFRIYLQEKYHVQKAYLFIGFLPTNQKLYTFLEEINFILKFKPTIPDTNGFIKGNVDADLVFQVLINWHQFHGAIIVSSDGDFYSLVRHLYEQGKLEKLISADKEHCSILLKQSAQDKIQYIDRLKEKLAYKKALLKDDTLRSAFS